MARSEARLQFGCWRTGLDGLSAHGKLLYAVLLTEPTLSQCGVGALRVVRWAKDASLTVAETEKALQELTAGKWVVTDEDTDEVFVRTLIRNDGIASQPYVLKGALREALKAESPAIRRALAAELRRLPAKRPDGTSKRGGRVVYPDPHATAEAIDPPHPPDDSKNPPETLFDASESERVSKGFPKAPETLGGGGGGGGTSTSSTTHVRKGSSAKAADDLSSGRSDVDQLCERLAERVAENDFKTPAGLASWRRQARLMLDRDKRDLTQALRLIDWSTSHHFWHSNIRSMSKFREKYDTLLAQARQGQQTRRPTTRNTDDKRADVPGLVAQVFGTSAMRPDLRAIEGGSP